MDWKKAIKGVAPAIATALTGGNVAIGAATKVLAGVLLGKDDASEAELETAVEGMTPDQRLQLQKADQDFAIEMAKIAQANEAVAAQDTANARDMKKETHSITPDVISYGVMALFAIELLLSRFYAVPPSNHDFAAQANNTLNLAVATVLGFWLGGAYSSRTQGVTIARALDKK